MDFQVGCTLLHLKIALISVLLLPAPSRHFITLRTLVSLRSQCSLHSQEMIIFLQNLPTTAWTDHDIELLLSEAYVLKTVWQGAENHFANLAKGNNQQFGMLGR